MPRGCKDLPQADLATVRSFKTVHLVNTGMTATEWGTLIGIDRSTASRLLRGRTQIQHRRPRLETAQALGLEASLQSNNSGMRNRKKGGLRAPAATLATPNSLAACAVAFLEHLAVRAYSQGSFDAHRWPLKGFVEWADSQELDTPAVFTRSTIESYQLHQFLRHRHPTSTSKPCGKSTPAATRTVGLTKTMISTDVSAHRKSSTRI
jgi:hypothetical protein